MERERDETRRSDFVLLEKKNSTATTKEEEEKKLNADFRLVQLSHGTHTSTKENVFLLFTCLRRGILPTC